MATLPSQNLQSVRALCFSSLNSPKFPSQIPSLKFPFLSAIKINPTKLCTSNNGISNSRLVPRASASEFSADIGDILGDVSIFTAAGQPVYFKDLWDQNQGIAVVALLRHFGCPCCWELALELKEAKARLDSAGVKLIAIGVGTPNKARMLAERKISLKGRGINRLSRTFQADKPKVYWETYPLNRHSAPISHRNKQPHHPSPQHQKKKEENQNPRAKTRSSQETSFLRSTKTCRRKSQRSKLRAKASQQPSKKRLRAGQDSETEPALTHSAYTTEDTQEGIRYHFQWIAFTLIQTARHMMFWACIMVWAVHSSIQPVLRCSQGLRPCRKL